MRKVCGLSVVLTSVSLAVLSMIPMTQLAAMGSSSKMSVGDPIYNLKLIVGGDNYTGTDDAAATSVMKLAKTEHSASLTDSTRETVKTLKPVKRKVLVFKATWCGACQSLKHEWPKLEKVGWRIGEKQTDHIQLVDADSHPDLMSRYGISSLPTLVLVDDDAEVSRRGSLGARNIAEFYYGRLK